MVPQGVVGGSKMYEYMDGLNRYFTDSGSSDPWGTVGQTDSEAVKTFFYVPSILVYLLLSSSFFWSHFILIVRIRWSTKFSVAIMNRTCCFLSSSISRFFEASGLSHVASCHKGVCFRKRNSCTSLLPEQQD